MKRTFVMLIAAFMLMSAVWLAPVSAEASTSDFFDDAVFLGDSITVGLANYCENRSGSKNLGSARFLAEVGYALAHTNKDDGYEKHPLYNGERLQPWKALEDMNPSRVFIALGVNDVGDTKSNIKSYYKRLITNIREALPKAEIFIIPIYPMTPTRENSKRSNYAIDNLNVAILQLAMSMEVNFVDVTPALKADGALNREYSSDDYVHFNQAGYAVLVKQLREYVSFYNATGGSASGSATIVNVSSFVNARAKASSSAKLVTTIPKGASVDIIEKASGKWYKVSYNGSAMYVYGKYLSVGSNGLSGTVTNVSSDANLRALPDEESKLDGTAKKGKVLSVSKLYYNPDWYRVLIGGEPSYISSYYLAVG